MYMKIFSQGKGRGELATNYLVKEDYANRHTPPSVLRGDHKLTSDLINSLDTVWKYTSGVLSWHPDDKVSPEKEIELMNDFEKLAFAGLEPDEYNILWVRHTHAGHHELHFVIPRVELSTGKSFNPCPPNWKKDFDPFQQFYNIKENWARPDDPTRARICVPEHADIKYNRMKRQRKEIVRTETDEVREFLLDYIVKRIENGLIKNRADIIASLEGLDFKINRQGKTYISVQDTENKHKIRFKGGIFNEHWRFAEESTSETRSGQNTDGASPTAELERLTRELTEIHAKRSAYNRGRYRNSKAKIQYPDEDELEKLYFSPSMLNFSDTRDIPIGGGRVSLFGTEYQHLENGTGSSGGSDDDSTGNANGHANMGDNFPLGQEWEVPHTATEHDRNTRLESWQTRRHQDRDGLNPTHNRDKTVNELRQNHDRDSIVNKSNQNHDNDSTAKEYFFDNNNPKETYERDTRISTKIIHPTRTGTFDNTEATLPIHTTTNNTNTDYQEQAEQLAQSMQVTKRGIAKLEHGIQELRPLIDRFKEYTGEKVKQGLGEEQQEQTMQETQSAPITTHATAQTSTPRRWRM